MVVVALSCADFERGPASPDGGASPSADGGGGGRDGGETVSYAADVHPLLISGCQSCHRSGGTAGDTRFVLSGETSGDYSTSAALVDEANPSQSRILRKASGQGHGGGAIYAADSPEYQTLLAWASGGALP